MSEQVLSVERRVNWWRQHLVPVIASGCLVALTVLDTPERIAAIAVAAGTFLCDWWWPAPRETRFVAVTEESIRVGDRTILWSDVNGARAGGGRIELVHDLETLVTIARGEVDHYEELVQTVARRVRISSSWLPKTPSVSVDATVVFLFLLLPAAAWVFAPGWWSWLGGAAFVLYAGWRLLDPHQIDFDDDGLRMRSVFFRTWFIPRAHIRAIYLTVGRNGRVRTRATVRGCADVDLALHRVDPLLIFEQARRAYPELVACP